MRKLVMTVLTLALILGSISVASAASGKVRLTDIADNANEEAIQVTYDLGIVTGTPEGGYEPDKAVNRAEFAALIVRALAIPDSALSSYTSTTFKDTSGYGWAVPYLAVLQQRGIMKGDGYGNAMPSRTITPNEAVTMVLRAIGYTDNASVLVGQWPANYVALGQNQVLYEKVANDLEMNKASAAQMIYNVLTKQLVQVDANSTVKYLYDTNNSTLTLLTTSLNCTGGGKGVITYSDASASKIDLIPRVGAYGILYKSNVDGEVVALTEVETVFLAGKFTYSGAGAGEVNKFKALDGTEYNLGAQAKAVVEDITSVAAISTKGLEAEKRIYGTFFNGNDARSVSGYTTKYLNYNTMTPAQQAAVTKADENASKLIVAAKVSGVTVQELRSVAVWDATIDGDTFLYESGQIDGKKFNGHDFPLDVSNEVDAYGYVLEGVNSLDNLAADNVVYIYKDAAASAGGKIKRIEVGTETQSGALTNINSADNQRTIGGKVLSFSPYSGPGISDLDTVNNEGTALLDIYGRIFAFQLGDASKGNYAVVVGLGTDGFNPAYKLFDKTGSDVVYGAKTGVTVPGAGTLVQYTLSGGKLGTSPVSGRNVTVAGTGANAGDFGYVNKAGTILTVYGGAEAGSYLIDSSVLVFAGDNSNNFGNFAGSVQDLSVVAIADLQDVTIKNGFWFYVDNNRVKAILVDSIDAGAQNIFVMINGVDRASDGAGGDVAYIKGRSFADGANATVKGWNYNGTITALGTDSTTNGLSPAIGTGRYSTMVQFKIGEDGVLKKPEPLYNYASDDPNRITSGAVYWKAITAGSGKTFTLTVDDDPNTVIPAGYDPIANPLGLGYVTFSADTVMYVVDGSWVSKAPTEGNFKANGLDAGYIFLMTDPTTKVYDVIIKL